MMVFHSSERKAAMQNLTKLLSISEVAEILGLSPHTIRSFVRQGKLSPVRICRRVLFSPDEVSRFICAGQVGPQSIAGF
jgi:excisionase family DNA binding protein